MARLAAAAVWVRHHRQTARPTKNTRSPENTRRESHWMGPRSSSKTRNASIKLPTSAATTIASRPVMNRARGGGLSGRFSKGLIPALSAAEVSMESVRARGVRTCGRWISLGPMTQAPSRSAAIPVSPVPTASADDSGPRGLDAIFRPRSIAVIGASGERGTLGAEILHNLLQHGFHGPVYPVNPKADSVHSVRAYPSIDGVPGPVDLAMVVVPAARVNDVLEACGKKGVRAAVVISAGF